MSRTKRRAIPCRGLTLAECLCALVILPLAVTAISYAVAAGQAQAVEALRRERSAGLAEDLMEEILALPYDPTTDDVLGAEEANRWSYDSPTDFSGFTEAAGGLQWVDRTGAAVVAYPENLQGFSRSVAMTACECDGAGAACDASLCETFGARTELRAKILSVTVTVNDDGDPMAQVTRLIVKEQ